MIVMIEREPTVLPFSRLSPRRWTRVGFPHIKMNDEAPGGAFSIGSEK